MVPNLKEIKVFLFDLDGCLYFGKRPAEGAAELLATLRADNKVILFVTNNSTETAPEIVDKLFQLGIKANENEMICTTDLIGRLLKNQFGSLAVKVFGSDALKKQVRTSGHNVLSLDHHQKADAVIVGRDISFDYEKLRKIALEISNGALIISTNPDGYHFNDAKEMVPETGSLVASVESMFDIKVPYIGKPAPYLFEEALRRSGAHAHEMLMVGDNLNTDIVGGNSMGIKTAWIQNEKVNINIHIKPDFILKSIEELFLLYFNKV